MVRLQLRGVKPATEPPAAGSVILAARNEKVRG
jgi:hypothetical protein